jgi:hypothetical protein
LKLTGSQHNESSEERFDFKIFQCVDLALSTIGETEKGATLTILERRFGLSGRNLALRPEMLEGYLKEILGVSVAAFIIIHIRENISGEFGLKLDDLIPISEVIEQARSKFSTVVTTVPSLKQ